MGAMARGQEQDLISGHEAPLRFGIPALLLGNVFLAFGPWFVRMTDSGPVASAFWRIALAIPVLFLVARTIEGKTIRPAKAVMGLFFISGTLFAADLAAWHIGILQTKLANATLLGNSTSFLLPLYAFLVARAWPTRIQAVALLLAGLGTLLLMGRSFELSTENFVGDLLCLLAGIFYTAYLILMGRAREGLGQWPVLAWSTLMSALPLLVFALMLGERLIPSDWTPLIALAFFSQVAGQGLMIYAIGRVAPLLFGITLLTQPVIAAAIGWFAYREALGVLDWIGAVLIGLALILVRQPDRKAA
jgi:drug/metabolite transporter (DMT)-like permease